MLMMMFGFAAAVPPVAAGDEGEAVLPVRPGKMFLLIPGRQILALLGRELSGLPNPVLIAGYTDSRAYHRADGYSNWELSADRANAARRLMQADGIRDDQVAQVRGFADQRLRMPADPLDASNRRISLIVQYVENAITEDDGHPAEKGPAGTETPKGTETSNGTEAPKPPETTKATETPSPADTPKK